jgi:hypothetical protein
VCARLRGVQYSVIFIECLVFNSAVNCASKTARVASACHSIHPPHGLTFCNRKVVKIFRDDGDALCQLSSIKNLRQGRFLKMAVLSPETRVFKPKLNVSYMVIFIV